MADQTDKIISDYINGRTQAKIKSIESRYLYRAKTDTLGIRTAYKGTAEPDGKTINDEYVLIIGTEQQQNQFSVPSFIDCSKSYKIQLDSTVSVGNLTNRSCTPTLRESVKNKILDMKKMGKHTEYSISLSDFKKFNKKISII